MAIRTGRLWWKLPMDVGGDDNRERFHQSAASIDRIRSCTHHGETLLRLLKRLLSRGRRLKSS